MKTVMKTFIWCLYIVAAPLILVFSIILLGYELISGCLTIKEAASAYWDGIKTGHKINMQNVDLIYGDDDNYLEGKEI